MPFSFSDEPMDERGLTKESLVSELGNGIVDRASGGGRKLDRELIAELILQLEKFNPTPSPATSPLVNGKWKFLYAGGQTPALASLRLLLKAAQTAPRTPSGPALVDIGETVVTITKEQPRVEAAVTVRAVSLENTIRLFSTLEVKTGSVMTETYKEIESQQFGTRPAQAPRNPAPRGLHSNAVLVHPCRRKGPIHLPLWILPVLCRELR